MHYEPLHAYTFFLLQIEGLFEVGEQVFAVFKADGETEQGIGQAARLANFSGDRAMRHGGRMADKRFHAAQAFSKGEDFEAAHDPVDVVVVTLELERDHAAETAHLAQ